MNSHVVTSSSNSQETLPFSNEDQVKPPTYLNRYGREVELISPLVTANEPLRLREVWRIQYLDLSEGETCQLFDIMNSDILQGSEEAAFEYIRTRIRKEWLWSVVVTRCRCDQYERMYTFDDQAVVQVPEELLRGERLASNVLGLVAA